MRSGSPAVPRQHNGIPSGAGGLISLSVRHFGEGLLIEVFDTDASPPVLTDAADDAENGRGLVLVDALSREWSYFSPTCGGKVVYCFIEIPMPLITTGTPSLFPLSLSPPPSPPPPPPLPPPPLPPGPCGTRYGTGRAMVQPKNN